MRCSSFLWLGCVAVALSFLLGRVALSGCPTDCKEIRYMKRTAPVPPTMYPLVAFRKIGGSGATTDTCTPATGIPKGNPVVTGGVCQKDMGEDLKVYETRDCDDPCPADDKPAEERIQCVESNDDEWTGEKIRWKHCVSRDS